MTKPPLFILLVGPTAVGKTEIAIQLAERLSGELHYTSFGIDPKEVHGEDCPGETFRKELVKQ